MLFSQSLQPTWAHTHHTCTRTTHARAPRTPTPADVVRTRLKQWGQAVGQTSRRVRSVRDSRGRGRGREWPEKPEGSCREPGRTQPAETETREVLSEQKRQTRATLGAGAGCSEEGIRLGRLTESAHTFKKRQDITREGARTCVSHGAGV